MKAIIPMPIRPRAIFIGVSKESAPAFSPKIGNEMINSPAIARKARILEQVRQDAVWVLGPERRKNIVSLVSLPGGLGLVIASAGL